MMSTVVCSTSRAKQESLIVEQTHQREVQKMAGKRPQLLTFETLEEHLLMQDPNRNSYYKDL